MFERFDSLVDNVEDLQRGIDSLNVSCEEFGMKRQNGGDACWENEGGSSWLSEW